MNGELGISTNDRTVLSMNPKKFGLWIFMGTIAMMFAAFTSAFIVGTSSSILDIELPHAFIWSTILIVITYKAEPSPRR